MATSLAVADAHLPHERMRRLLGRLSAGRQWDPVCAIGGQAEITWEDVCRALRRIRRINKRGESVPDVLVQALLGYHWGGVESDQAVVVRELMVRLSLWAARDGWRKRTNGAEGGQKWLERTAWLRDMATMATEELVRRQPCLECCARGSVWQVGSYHTETWRDGEGKEHTSRLWVQGHWVPCEACRGLGVHPWSKRERALRMGVHPSTWSQAWDERYLDLLAFIDRVEQRGLRKLRKVMG